MKEISKDLLLKVFEKVKQKNLLDEEVMSFLERIFPDKSPDVIEVLKRGITQYICKPSNRVVWTAMGKNQEHLIYPSSFCSCQDYYKNVVINRKRDYCKHILAQIISEALNEFKKVILNDREFKDIIKDLNLQI